jgi:hypothetical protein
MPWQLKFWNFFHSLDYHLDCNHCSRFNSNNLLYIGHHKYSGECFKKALDLILSNLFQDVDGLMGILEITNPSAVRPSMEQVAWAVRIFPSIIMLLTASKLFFFLFCNVVWVVAIARAGKAASTYHKYVDNSRRNYASNMGAQNPTFDNDEPKNQSRNGDHRSSVSHELPISSSPENAETRYNDTTRVQGFAYVRNDRRPQSPMIAEEELNYRIQRPATVASPQQDSRPMSIHVQHYEKTTYHNVDPEIENRLSRYQESNGVVIRTVEPLKNDDIPDHQKSIIGVRVLPPVARSMSENKTKPVPPPKPNNRYSMQPMMEKEEPVLYRPQDRPTNPPKLDRNSSSIKPVPAELRNQFAFNYLVDPNGQSQVPKRSFRNLSEDEESPAVPVPDYTLHFPPSGRKRTNWSNSDEDYSGQWSQQNQQRY